MPQSPKCCNCSKNATYNYEGKAPEYCKGHALKDMIYVNRLCINCRLKARSFNYQNKKPMFCKTCKKIGMINTVFMRKCKCKKAYPLFNYLGLKPEYCLFCAQPGMIDVSKFHKKVKSPVIPPMLIRIPMKYIL